MTYGEQQGQAGILGWLSDAFFFLFSFFNIVTMGLESFFLGQLEASSASWDDGNLQQDS